MDLHSPKRIKIPYDCVEGVNMPENTITLKFADSDTVDYINLICKRKCVDLESYILDNFEWDDPLTCIVEGGEITSEMCEGCNFADGCPDVVNNA